MNISETLKKYEGKRRILPATRRPPNPPLNHTYIKRKWLGMNYASGSERALMDIYLPNDGEGPFPVIFFIHGGGFFTGDRNDFEVYPPLEGLKRGYAVCSIDYTLSGEAIFPRQIQECKAAVRFIRANAKKYNLDTSCIIAWGMSAGANLAAMIATTGYKSFPELEDDSMGNPSESCAVDACMIWYCPTFFSEVPDLFKESGVIPRNSSTGEDSVMAWYLGIALEDAYDLAELANPENYISKETPPFVMQHGKLDPVVPYQQSVRFAQKLREIIGEENVRFTLFEDYAHADDRRFDTMYNCSLVLDDLETLLGRK